MTDGDGAEGAKTYTQAQLDAEVAGLKSKNQELLGSLAGVKEKLKAWDGLEPDKVRQLIADREKDSRGSDGEGDKGNLGNKDFERILEKRAKEIEGKFAPVVEELGKTKARLRTMQLDDQVKSAALKAGMLPEDVDDEMDILLRGRAKRFDLNDDGKVVVFDDQGDPTGKTPEQWFSEVYKGKKPKVFAGTGGPGSGSRGSDGGGGDASVIRLTREQASDHATMQAALKKVGGDYARVKIEGVT